MKYLLCKRLRRIDVSLDLKEVEEMKKINELMVENAIRHSPMFDHEENSVNSDELIKVRYLNIL